MGLAGGAGLEWLRERRAGRATSGQERKARLLRLVDAIGSVASAFQTAVFAAEFYGRQRQPVSPGEVGRNGPKANEGSARVRFSRHEVLLYGPAAAVPLVDEALEEIRQLQKFATFSQVQVANETAIKAAYARALRLRDIADEIVLLDRPD